MRVKELAEFIGCSPSLITSMVKAGELASVRVDGTTRETGPHGFYYELEGTPESLKKIVKSLHPYAGDRLKGPRVEGFKRTKDAYTVLEVAQAAGRDASQVRKKAKELGVNLLDVGKASMMLQKDAARVVDYYREHEKKEPPAEAPQPRALSPHVIVGDIAHLRKQMDRIETKLDILVKGLT